MKKSLFDKIMDNWYEMLCLGIAGTFIAERIVSLVSLVKYVKHDEEERSSRIQTINELQKSGAKVNINLEGDI